MKNLILTEIQRLKAMDITNSLEEASINASIADYGEIFDRVDEGTSKDALVVELSMLKSRRKTMRKEGDYSSSSALELNRRISIYLAICN
jgi:hypothetical protein